MRLLTPFVAIAALFAVPAAAQERADKRATVQASVPTDLSVTVYRDPNRGERAKINRNWPQGFAMISETRTVTLPAGESTIRFDGVAEGMVAVSAIVTGLPEGTIEKNRNAELLSPAALVNGALGNRVTITRTNPATGVAKSEDAVVRTRADGGLVLQTQQGYEAVRCAGLPEKLTFNGIPRGLSAIPVYSVNTRSSSGGTFEVVLTYISWGFDWQANYVGTVTARRRAEPAMMAAMAPLAEMEADAVEQEMMKAVEENLGDLKLYRVPERVNVSAKGMKQVAFLNEDAVQSRFLYRSSCPFAVTPPTDAQGQFYPAEMLLTTKNEEERGLGMALPQGGLAVFIPAPGPITEKNQHKWFPLEAEVTNANSHPITLLHVAHSLPQINRKAHKSANFQAICKKVMFHSCSIGTNAVHPFSNRRVTTL